MSVRRQTSQHHQTEMAPIWTILFFEKYNTLLSLWLYIDNTYVVNKHTEVPCVISMCYFIHLLHMKKVSRTERMPTMSDSWGQETGWWRECSPSGDDGFVYRGGWWITTMQHTMQHQQHSASAQQIYTRFALQVSLLWMPDMQSVHMFGPRRKN